MQGMRKNIPGCIFNCICERSAFAVECEEENRNCDKCGWNPAVEAERKAANEIRYAPKHRR